MSKELLYLLGRRVTYSLIVLFLLISFIFVLVRLSPGDPAQKYLSPELNPQLAEKVRESFKLDEPVGLQYLNFLGNIIKGNFGASYNYRLPVLSVILDYLPFTLIFSSLSFLIQISFGFLLALISVRRAGKIMRKVISNSALIAYAAPSFVLGVFLIYIFSVKLDWFPSSGLVSLDFASFNFFGKVMDYIRHLVLPLLTLSLAGVAMYYKYLRDNLEDVYNRTFVLFLRSHGFSEKEILIRHIIPNSVQPLIAVAGIELGLLFGGALITEVIFGLPGMGRLTINAILVRDYPLVIGCSFIAGLLLIITNLAADLIRYRIDKRMLKGIIN